MYALEPGEEGKIFLEKHLSLDEDKRPYCVVTALSARQSREVAREWDNLFSSQLTADEFQDKITEFFTRHVKSWSGYGEGEVEDVFTRPAMLEILRSFIGGRLHYYEKKS